MSKTNLSMTKSRFRTMVCSIVILLTHAVWSQAQDYIHGRLLDAKTQEPIAFASIAIKGRALGVISNTDGSFKIPMKYKTYGDIIELSSMGYQTQEILIQDLSVYELNNIRLQPAIMQLEEAIVTARRKRMGRLTAKEIVQRAIGAIPLNYPTRPFSQVGYYRDYQYEGGQYVNLNEAILEVFDQGFQAVDSSTTKVMLYEYRENFDFPRDTLARAQYDYSFKGRAKIIDKGYLEPHGGNEFTILSVHNAIRNNKIDSYSFVHRLQTDLVKEHGFSRADDSSIEGHPLYTIAFRKKIANHSAFGKLYISKYDYAIYQMDYAVYDDSKRNATGLDDENGSNKKKMFDIKTSYRKTGDKMYLRYISFNNRFKLWEPPKFWLDSVNLRFDKRVINKIRGRDVKKRWIALTFNEIVNADYVQDLRKFRIYFKGRNVPLKGYLVAGKTVLLYPKANTKRQVTLLEELERTARAEGLNEETLAIRVKDIKDVKGNLLGVWTSKQYNQFRELFVQQLKTAYVLPQYVDFMDKKRPIFQNQPTVKPENFNDYWMNTPLHQVKN